MLLPLLQGTMISVPQSANWPRALRFSFFNKDSVPHVFLIARKPNAAAGNGSQESDGWQQAKKRQGQFQGKIKVSRSVSQHSSSLTCTCCPDSDHNIRQPSGLQDRRDLRHRRQQVPAVCATPSVIDVV